MIVIDATDLLLGRFAGYAAKQALLGKEIRVINCEKAVVSGNIPRVKKRRPGCYIRYCIG